MDEASRSTTAPRGAGAGHRDLASQLRAELERLRTAGPHAALGVAPDAGAAEVRAAFLAVTKKYHPNRFARMERETVRLANEVFLVLKEAYAGLMEQARREAEHAAMRAPTLKMGALQSEAAPAAKPAGQSPSQSGTEPGSDRRRRVSSRPPSTSRRLRFASQLSAGVGTERSTRRDRPLTGTERARIGTDSLRDVDAALKDTARRRNEQFELALKLSRDGRFEEARKLLQKVSSEDVHNKKFRVHLHYVWGLEHEDAGRIEEAKVELQRAIAIDPQFRRAHEALDRLPGGGGKKGGFFSKLFGR